MVHSKHSRDATAMKSQQYGCLQDIHNNIVDVSKWVGKPHGAPLLDEELQSISTEQGRIGFLQGRVPRQVMQVVNSKNMYI